ncbi:MAG: UvrB/UvrC motif-containing protein [Candidatus Magasanikbacteria bacterium]
MNIVEKKLKKLPDTPGVYLFFDVHKKLIYVGKATSLRDRVRSYFRNVILTRQLAGKDPSRSLRDSSVTPQNDIGARPIEQMIHEVKDIKIKKTDSVLEAIILEGNLIKKFRPKYNIDWKDDKSWNYIVITADKYPQVKFVREHEIVRVIPAKAGIQAGGADPRFRGDDKQFGPYPHLKMREFEKILRKLFAVSFCKPNSGRPCLYRQIGQCLGVCVGEITPADYNKKVIKPLVIFLSGKKRVLIKSLNTKMIQASKSSDFEEAGRLRDQIKSLQHIQDIALLNNSFTSPVILSEAKDPFPLLRDSSPPKADQNDRRIRIEGYDISNLGESDKVGSMVVFDENGPMKSQYRKFNIKTVVGQSDVDCMAEVLGRRLKHSEWPLPSLFLIDGGLPQVNRVKKILHTAKVSIAVVGIAKGPTRKNNQIILGDKSQQLAKWVYSHIKLLIQVRDEAHRFAITFNRSKRIIR